jgi:NAD(P)-dependent dehydrogenase (short-subunit alcohol dehydrogenase family)
MYIKRSMMAGKLSSKRALVTGSATGVGRGIALELAKAGAAVVLHYASSKTGEAIQRAPKASRLQRGLDRPLM